ncbi:hypothetical protein ACH42_07845 [Endozoicomonas sp. (ex Bugula neritina AB1)]|nr:hypothetical protein ACH42_07845 [Endozoicomonas sp. (ex Bugula neritina AB1)]
MQSKFIQSNFGKSLPIAVITTSLLLLAGCDGSKQQTPPSTPPPGVSVLDVTTQPVGKYQEFVARTEAVDTVELRARVEGFLVKREFSEGQSVDNGQLLFKIDPKPYQAEVKRSEAELSSSKANLAKARRDLARSKDLFQKGHISQSNYDTQIATEAQATSSVKIAEAGLETARLNLGYTDISAPFKGKIGKARYSVGNLVGSTSDPLATLTSVDPMYVNFQVDEKQLINYLEKNKHLQSNEQTFQLTLRLPNDREYDHEGVFNFSNTVVDETTGTLTLRAAFPNPDGILFPGLYVTLISESKEKQKLPVIPQVAVQENQSGRFVLVVNSDNLAEIRQITTGRRIDAMWIVEDGLKSGEKIIVAGLQKVRTGAKVTPSVVTVDPRTGAIQSTAQNQEKGN